MEPLAKESQYAPLTDPLLEKLPPMAPVEIGEKSPDIRVHDPGDGQRPALLTQLVQRLVLTVPFSEAMGEHVKLMLEDGLQNHHPRALDKLVLEAGFTYRPLLPIFLCDPYPLDWRRPIPIGAPSLVQVPEVVGQVVGIRRGRHFVHSRRTALTGLTLGFPQELAVDHVKHMVEHHRWIALGLLGNALELHGYGW